MSPKNNYYSTKNLYRFPKPPKTIPKSNNGHSLLAQICRCADALAEHGDPNYVLNDPSLNDISEKRWTKMGATKFP